MAEDGSRQLANALNRVASRVEHMENSLAGRLDKTREVIQKGTEATLEELRAAQQVTARMEIAKLISELNAIRPMIHEQNEILKQEVSRINGRQNRIIEKYNSMEAELHNSYTRDMRRLGAHIYDILENDYQKGIEQRYERSHYGMLSQVVTRSAYTRQNYINEHLAKAQVQVRNFVGIRQRFRESLSHKLIKVKKDIDGKRVAVPFWIVGVRDNNGVLSNMVIGPARIKGSRKGTCHYVFERDNDFKSIEETIKSISEKVIRGLPPERKDMATVQTLSQSIESLSGLEKGGITSSLKKLILGKVTERKTRVSY